MNPTLANAAVNLKRRADARLRKLPRTGRARATLPALWLMTDEKRMPNPESAVCSLPRGAGVILRHYGDPNRAALALRLAGVCRRRGLVLVVASDWRLASRVNAAGIHLPDHMSRCGPPAAARLWQRRNARLLTVSAHGLHGLRRAMELRATAVFLAPVFVTPSHPERRPLGAMRCAAMVREARVPVVALGGVTAATANGLRSSGFAGIAGIGFASPT